ncbi:MAG: hypothetical protein SFV81_29205, partial [Pirellulaceae bacterium]|nr:hypothetical protein [Pirellulaceae bacterium]
MGTDVPKDCLQSIEKAELALRNAELKYRKELRGEPSVSGFMRIRSEMIQSEYQYEGDPRIVFVWRPDASFRLEEVGKAWVPRGLRPGSSKREFGGPNFPLAHLQFGSTRLLEVLQNSHDSPYETLSFRKQSPQTWNATIARRKSDAREKSDERWIVTLDESQHWLPVQLTYQERDQQPAQSALTKFVYRGSL